MALVAHCRIELPKGTRFLMFHVNRKRFLFSVHLSRLVRQLYVILPTDDVLSVGRELQNDDPKIVISDDSEIKDFGFDGLG